MTLNESGRHLNRGAQAVASARFHRRGALEGTASEEWSCDEAAKAIRRARIEYRAALAGPPEVAAVARLELNRLGAEGR